MPEGSSDLITDLSNPNRTTLKILNDKYQDPIKAKCTYNKATGLIEVTVTYLKYGINKIILEDTTELQMTNTNGVITANTAGIDLEDGTYTITITDNNNNLEDIEIEVQTAEKAPTNMTAYRNNVGSIYTFLVTGNITVQGTVWGSDIYTDDSNIAKAVVHAGVLKNGETGIVKIEVMKGRSSYSASTRNGVTTSKYGSWPGSYRFVK